MPFRVRIALLLALVAAACGGGEQQPPTPGELKDFAAVCDKANEGKRVAAAGYLRFPDKFSGDRSVVLRMYQAADLAGKPVGVQTMIGKQANQVEAPPKQFTDKDLKVHLTNGQVAGLGTKVKVSGDVYYPVVGQDFQCALSNPLVEPAPGP
jgi:hypothetical protein